METNGKWFNVLQKVQTFLLGLIVTMGGFFAVRLWDQVQKAQESLMENRVIMVEMKGDIKAVSKENGDQSRIIEYLDLKQREVLHRLDILENGKAKP